MLRSFFALTAVFGGIGLAPAQASDPPTDVDRAAAFLVDTGAPGVGVGLYADGAARCAVAGRRRIEDVDGVEEADLWHIGSITKSMTATLAARLVERGVLSWDTTVGELLIPQASDGGARHRIHPGYQGVTLEHLLSHRGGTRQALTAAELNGSRDRQREAPDMRSERRRFVAMTLNEPPATPPGLEFSYSNIGYVTAGAMIEAATGLSWEAALRADVFEPLGIMSAGFGAPGQPDTVDQPRGHRSSLLRRLRSVEPGPAADNPAVLGPAGTVHMSLCDLLRYVAAHAERPEGFLTAESWERLHSSHGDNYALGWSVAKDGERRIHNGSNTFWYAIVGFSPTARRAVAIVTNDGRAKPMPDATLRLLDRLLP